MMPGKLPGDIESHRRGNRHYGGDAAGKWRELSRSPDPKGQIPFDGQRWKLANEVWTADGGSDHVNEGMDDKWRTEREQFRCRGAEKLDLPPARRRRLLWRMAEIRRGSRSKRNVRNQQSPEG